MLAAHRKRITIWLGAAALLALMAFAIYAYRARTPEPRHAWLKIYDGHIRDATPEEEATYDRYTPPFESHEPKLPSGKPVSHYTSANGYEDATDSDGNHYVRRGLYWVPAPPGR